MKTALLPITALLCLTLSCRTAHFNVTADVGPTAKQEGITSLEAERKANEKEQEALFIEEELKEVDVEKTIVYIDRPVYSPELPPQSPRQAARMRLPNRGVHPFRSPSSTPTA